MLIKTSELEGPALDWAVSHAVPDLIATEEPNGWYLVENGTLCLGHVGRDWSPSTNWAQGGPLIEQYKICIMTPPGEDSHAGLFDWPQASGPRGRSPLIAAMRAIVASQIGDAVDIPDELTAD